MMKLVPFKKEHAAPILALKEYRGRVSHFPDEQLDRIAEIGRTVTVLWNDEVIAFGGVSLYWENRGDAWMMVDRAKAKAHFIAFHRIISKFLDSVQIQRLEANVEIGFELGKRWTELLGFRLETERASAYFPDGSDATIYARIRRAA